MTEDAFVECEKGVAMLDTILFDFIVHFCGRVTQNRQVKIAGAMGSNE